MSTAKTIDLLRSRLAELTLDIFRHQNELDQLTRERDALNLALKSIEGIQEGVLNRSINETDDGNLTYKQQVVFGEIPLGQENALPPALIGKRCPSIEADYVRKTLKRLSEYGIICSADSKYWRES